MADGIKISALTEATDAQTVDGNLLETAVVDSSSSTGFSSKKTPISRLAKYVLDKYTGLSLGGVTRTVKTAIDALKTATDALDTEMDTKADTNGTYDDLVVGTSKQLLSESYTEDFTPYKFRKSPYTDRLSESIVGASVAWNQLAKNNAPTNTLSGVTFTNNGDGTFDISGTATGNITFNATASGAFTLGAGHKYFILGCPSGGSASTYYSGIGGLALEFGGGAIWANSNYTSGYPSFSIKNGTTVNFTKVSFIIIDLTQMFGTTVADALYAMRADGVALFRSWYPKPYYEYSAPTLEHVSGLEAHEMVGWNQWDEVAELGYINPSTGENQSSIIYTRSKNYIPILPNTEYYCKKGDTATTVTTIFYDADKNYISGGARSWNYGVMTTPSNACYMRFAYTGTTYNNDICVNISDPTRNGTYKPYSKHSYALDASLTLRGLIKYDATKGFYADGDVYKADGTVDRRYGIVDLGTLTWGQSGSLWQANASIGQKASSQSVSIYESLTDWAYFTSTANTSESLFVGSSGFFVKNASNRPSGLLVYELATPTTESAEPFEAIQITDGTEEYITECLAPVGHESKYYENLRSKIEGLPTDFSAIICATEPTSKASKNYAVGDYLIYGNTLYKVTTAIATDATLTVGTNITATTIMAEIKALQ